MGSPYTMSQNVREMLHAAASLQQMRARGFSAFVYCTRSSKSVPSPSDEKKKMLLGNLRVW